MPAQEVSVDALADTGTLHLCIPDSVARELNLTVCETRTVTTADGRMHHVPYAGPVEVKLNGHTCFAGALVMGNQVLLGAVPMEDMNVVVCPTTRQIVVNPTLPMV